MHGAHLDEHNAAAAKVTRPRRPAEGEQAPSGGVGSLFTLQQAAGNRAVASMLGPVQRTAVQRTAVQRTAVQRTAVQRTAVQRTVQRCGPGSDCGCSPEEQAQHAATHAEGGDQTVQRSADDDHDHDHEG
jgi:hypothetical protein